MPNNHISYCPYYVSEMIKTITCEDTIRRFSGAKSKGKWQNRYCHRQHGWEKCPHAEALNDLYDRTDEMSSAEGRITYLMFVVEAKNAEINKLMSALGMAEKTISIMGRKDGN